MNEVGKKPSIGPDEVVAERIIHFIDEMNGAASAKSIEKGVKGKNKTIYAALDVLVESGVLIKKGNGGKGDPITYHRAINRIEHFDCNTECFEQEQSEQLTKQLHSQSIDVSLELNDADIQQLARVYAMLEVFRDKLVIGQ